MRFILEKPLSQSTVDTGDTRSLSAATTTEGYVDLNLRAN
jgi:hypothetical protein